ncbi:hypothetical protein T03_15863, partial [Trichinella britovi]
LTVKLPKLTEAPTQRPRSSRPAMNSSNESAYLAEIIIVELRMHKQPVVSRLRRRPSRSARTFESNDPKIAPIWTHETVIDHSVISCVLDNALMHYKSGTACPFRSLPQLAPN